MARSVGAASPDAVPAQIAAPPLVPDDDDAMDGVDDEAGAGVEDREDEVARARYRSNARTVFHHARGDDDTV